MDSINSNLYSNIRLRMSNSQGTDAKWNHDESKEDAMIVDLQEYKKAAKQLYLRSILNPECHVAKVPSRMPVDSATAALRYNFTITPNASGKFVLIIDPYYYQGFLYQDSTVNGTGSGTLTSVTFAQDATLIDQWRLVSSSLILKYYGNFNQMSGLFVASTTSNVSAAASTTYLTFSNIEDLTNKQVLKCIDGCKLIFSPMDEKATEFQSVSSYTGGSHPCRWQYLFVVYGDLFPNAGFIRADFFRNIEYTSTPSYKEYITQTKDLPNDNYLPNVVNTISSAPLDFTGKPMSNGKSWNDEVKDFAKEMMNDVVGTGIRNINPFAFDKIGRHFSDFASLGTLK